MRHFLAGLFLALAATSPALAQDASAVESQIERLHAQLRDVVEREAQLQDRAAGLDEDLRPENVERSVAGVGTTDAGALRAKRREALEKQKNDVAAQLAEASAKRAKLEAEIAAAEAEAVRLKAATLAPHPASPNTAPAARRKAPARKSPPRRRNRPKRRA